MKRLDIRIFMYAMLLAMMFSCSEKAEVELLKDIFPKPYQVISILENSDVQNVTVNRLADKYIGSYLPVDDAEVIIAHTGGKEYLCTKLEPGRWQTNLRPASGEEYKLIVKIPGLKEAITATTVYPDTLRRFPDYQDPDNIVNLDYMGYKDEMYRKDSAILWMSAMDYVPEGGYVQTEKMEQLYSGIGDFSYPYRIIPGYDGKWIRKKGCLARNKEIQYIVQAYAFPVRFLGLGMGNISISFKGVLYSSSNPEYQKIKMLHPKSYFLLESVSDEYDKYREDMFAVEIGEKDIVNAYSNIDHASGVFGAVYRDRALLIDCQPMEATVSRWDYYDIDY